MAHVAVRYRSNEQRCIHTHFDTGMRPQGKDLDVDRPNRISSCGLMLRWVNNRGDFDSRMRHVVTDSTAGRNKLRRLVAGMAEFTSKSVHRRRMASLPNIFRTVQRVLEGPEYRKKCSSGRGERLGLIGNDIAAAHQFG